MILWGSHFFKLHFKLYLYIFIKCLFLLVCMYVSADVCAMCVSMPKEDQEDIEVPLKMEFQDALSGPTWVTGIQLRAASSLNF